MESKGFPYRVLAFWVILISLVAIIWALSIPDPTYAPTQSPSLPPIN